ncbi:MAG: RluA family pseudouridine synthase [Lachnospiraceae bacterium]|nr:RluA family pseudouridine synthase [Lachnospiraceae bacterium]
MREIIIGKNEAGQRADKFLSKYLCRAQKNFIYKMIRKKNITLNNKKMCGNEKLVCGDSVKLFFSEETLSNFTEAEEDHIGIRVPRKQALNFKQYIIYEDENIILMNKPAGMLSQKTVPGDCSINEYMINYLLESGFITRNGLSAFRPAVCNRLDRNTSGLIIGGTSLAGLQEMSLALKERTLHKYYLCIVRGIMKQPAEIQGWLSKDEQNNKVNIYPTEQKNAAYICTRYFPIASNSRYTLLEVCLVTGKPHQIRAHLSSIGHPIAGDGKYGDKQLNQKMFQDYHLKFQLLHSYRLDFRDYTAKQPELKYLEGKVFFAPPDAMFQKILKEEGFDGYLEKQRTAGFHPGGND